MYTIRPWLYVGKYRETLDPTLLADYRIGAMLHLADSVTHPGLTTLYLPVEDGVPLPSDILEQGIDFVLAEKRSGQSVLIACGAGISRSVTYAVAALKETEGLSLLEAVLAIKEHHPFALPHPALWKSLCTYYQEDVPFYTMLRELRA